MYPVVIALHNLGRYAVLGLALFALWRAVSGLLARGGWLPADDKARRLFPVALDIQFTIGLVLYALSPLTRVAFQDFGAAMANPVLRFYAVEHLFVGLVAIALAHIGSAKIRKAKSPREKFRFMAIFYGLALLSILSRMPWDRWIPRVG